MCGKVNARLESLWQRVLKSESKKILKMVESWQNQVGMEKKEAETEGEEAFLYISHRRLVSIHLQRCLENSSSNSDDWLLIPWIL